MKRIAQLTLALLLALALMLPAAAIINIDGSDPDWDGYAGIRPASDVLVIGDIEPDVEDYYEYNGPDRSQFARDDEMNFIDVPELEGSGIMAINDYLDIEPINAEIGHSVPVALFYATLAVAVLALVLAIVALVKKK